jgi:ribosomal protein S18 acetylase RimI-like enzyme
MARCVMPRDVVPALFAFSESMAHTSTVSVTLMPIQPSDAADLTRFHRAHLTGRLSSLGASYTHFFYTAALARSDVFGHVARRDGEIVGFVIGSVPGSRLISSLVRSAPLRWSVESLKSFGAHPRATLKVFGELFQRSAAEAGAELHFIAVRADLRGQSVGTQLFRRFTQEASRRQIRRFSLSVGTNNLAALRFYEGLGGRVTGSAVAAGEPMKTFLFEVA